MQSPNSHSPSPSPSPVQFIESNVPQNRSPIVVDESDSAPAPVPVVGFRATADADSLAKSSLSVQIVGTKRGADVEPAEQNGEVKRPKVGEEKEEVSAVVVDDDDDNNEEEEEEEGDEGGDVDDVELVREDAGGEKEVTDNGGEVQFVETKGEEGGVKVGAGGEGVEREGNRGEEIGDGMGNEMGGGAGNGMGDEAGREERGMRAEGRLMGEKKEETTEQDKDRKESELKGGGDKGSENKGSENEPEKGGKKMDTSNAEIGNRKDEDLQSTAKGPKIPSTENGQGNDSKMQDIEKAEEKDGGEVHRAESDDEEEAPLDLAAMSAFEYEQVAKLTPTQLRRYEQFRRSDLKNGKVKKVLIHLNPMLTKASEQYVIAVKGLAKLFVGDVVESALEVKKQLGDKGALQPKHLREAYRRLRKNGAIPTVNDKSNLFP